MDKDELLERYEALGEDGDFLAAKPLFEAEIRRRQQSEQGLHGPEDALLLRQYGYLPPICEPGRMRSIGHLTPSQRNRPPVGRDDDVARYPAGVGRRDMTRT